MASESDWLVFAANFSPVAVSDREKARSGAEASILGSVGRGLAAIDRRPTVALEFPRRCYSVRTHAAGAAPARARSAPVPQRVGVRRRRARSSRAAGLCRPDERRVRFLNVVFRSHWLLGSGYGARVKAKAMLRSWSGICWVFLRGIVCPRAPPLWPSILHRSSQGCWAPGLIDARST